MFFELRSALRALRRAPGYTVTVIVTLALGIGMATGFYSLFARSLFPRTPYLDAGRLMRVEVAETGVGASGTQPPFLLGFAAYRAAKSFSGVAGATYEAVNLVLGGEPEGIFASRVTTDYFSLLGVVPARGRTFLPEDGRAGVDEAAMVSDKFWRDRLGADPAVLERSLRLNERNCRIVGVLPADFVAPAGLMGGQDIFLPFMMPAVVDDRSAFSLMQTIGRLKPGVTAAQAEAELRTMHPEAGKPYAKYMEKFAAVVSAIMAPLDNVWTKPYRRMQWTGVAAIGFLYLIACVNAGSLMLVRVIGRRREIAVRLALGARRRDVVRPLLWESLLLSLGAITLGLLVAKWLMPALLAAVPGGGDRWGKNVTLSWESAGFLAALGLLTGLAVVLGPAWQAIRMNLNDAVKDGSQASGESPRTRRLRGGLVVVEAALAVVLLAGAGLMVRTYARIAQTKPGYELSHRFGVVLARAATGGAKPALVAEQRRQILERLATVPGVRGVGLAGTITPSFYYPHQFRIVGRTDVGVGGVLEAQANPVSPEFLDTLGVALRAGRSLAGRRPSDPPALVINETMARLYFAGRSPLGERLALGPGTQWEIVGVVADMRAQREGPKPRCYFPYWQAQGWSVDQVLVRTAGAPGAKFQAEIRRAIYAVDPQLAVTRIASLAEERGWAVASERFALTLLQVLAGLALLLAATGVSATMAYSVAQRRGEFGIRLTLGATPRSIYRLVLGSGLALVALGVGLGLAATWALARFLETLLFETSAHDPLTYGVVGLLLLVVALPACWWPARRATKVDLTSLLRAE
ncbi:MAG: ABC transporter permease [Opitutae bacterium]|nr:ABC transporter permease [Opitutae bacterium]